MLLKDRLEQEGVWLFRLRSYLPLLLLPVMLLALRHSDVLERHFGEPVEAFWTVFCLSISLLGVAIRALTIGFAAPGTSGRNTRRQRADSLNTSGIYSAVRHPLYLGNFCIFLGVVLLTEVWWFALIGVLVYWLYYERIIMAEERYLRDKFGEAYDAWAAGTPIFIPRIGGWKRSALPFGAKTVLKRETSTLFATILGFVVLQAGKDYFAGRDLEVGGWWSGLLAFTLVLYLVVRYLRKRTHLLDT